MAPRWWEALHRPLVFAAKDRFLHLDQIAGLGPTLRGAADRLKEHLLGHHELATAAERYAGSLRHFEDASRTERARLVAEGLRLCAAIAAELPECQRQPLPERAAEPSDEPPGPRSPLTVLRGVGPVIAARLDDRGLSSVEELLYFLPLEYQDRRDMVPLDEAGPEWSGKEVTTRGWVVGQKRGRPRGRVRMLELELAALPSAPAVLSCVWFRAHPGMAKRFAPGQPVRVSGAVREYQGRLQMSHPDIDEERDGPASGGIRRRYPEVEGVAPRTMEQLCEQACRRFADEVEDAIPPGLASELGLMGQADALRWVHLVDHEPAKEELALLQRGDHPSHRRLVMDELFSLQLAVALRRSSWEQHRAHPCRVTERQAAELQRCLPFALTSAQERAIGELLESMSQARPMHRLLQGDVGSGKTAVAFAAVHAAMTSGLQAAVMAPTEILARQHYQVMEPWCRALGRRAALLTGETPRAARSSLLALADGGHIQLLVGTHALLSREVNLPDLGLAVVDEQHRFGVIQRVRFRDRGADQPLPHLLVMTATPIPRTLALTAYGDLDLSLLDERPPGRRPPHTLLFLGAERGRAYDLVEDRLRAGQQAFVVCPLVEESESSPAADAVSTAERLRARFAEFGVGLVHGRIPPLERDRTMAAFRARSLQLLVATTVIEVGIDVPSAGVMVVENAERFGLAQLHQLRGRVGRGEEESWCLLLSGAAEASARLSAMARTNDGFEIAEADLELRGPGELFGTRQSGVPRLRFADLRRHLALLAEAQRAAAGVVRRDPSLSFPEHRHAREVMVRRWESLSLVGAEAG